MKVNLHLEKTTSKPHVKITEVQNARLEEILEFEGMDISKYCEDEKREQSLRMEEIVALTQGGKATFCFKINYGKMENYRLRLIVMHK